MNIIYLVYMPSWQRTQGVINKIADQISIWNQSNELILIFISDRYPSTLDKYNFSLKFFPISSFFSKISVFNKVYSYLGNIEVDIIYFRTIVPFFGMKRILNNFNCILEINSLVRSELNRSNKTKLRDYINYFKNIFSLSYHKFLKGIVCVTYEIFRSENTYNIPSIVIPNGISGSTIYSKVANYNSIPQLVFVGSPGQYWHGVEEILEFADLVHNVLDIHVVGAIMTDVVYSQNNVTFYPYIDDSEIDQFLSLFDIAICSSALFKKNMFEACPLKTRKYFKLGLPMIMPYLDTIFIDRDVPDFVLKISNEKGSLKANVNRIIEFCYKYKDFTYNFSDYQFEIDSVVLEERRLNFFRDIVRNNSIFI